jgi:hypothetical protein
MDGQMDERMDWIQKYEELNIKMQTKQEEEMPEYITLYFYYVGGDSVLEKIKKHKYKPIQSSVITVGEILKINENRARGGGYRLDDLFLYEAKDNHIKHIPLVLENIEIKPLLFIYHDIHSVYFIYKKKQINNKSIRAPVPAGGARRTKRARARTPHTAV